MSKSIFLTYKSLDRGLHIDPCHKQTNMSNNYPTDNYVCLRLNERPGKLPDFAYTLSAIRTLLLEKYVDQRVPYLCVHELGENDKNPHWHLAFRCVGKMQALRQFLTRNGFKGNESYSLKAGDPNQMDAHFDYLCKGTGTGKEDGPNVVFRHEDFTDSVIDERHDVFWKKNQEIRDRQPKRKREEPASKMILAICQQKLEHSGKSAISEDELIDITLEWYKKNKWSMNTFQMKSVVNYVSYCLNPDSNRVAMMKNALKFN